MNFNFAGCPGPLKLHFSKVNINCTTFLATWRSPGDNGGVEVEVNRFTVWYRLVVTNNTKGKWLKFNTTKTNYYVTLECCSTYEIMVTAWKRNCPSMADPDNAAKVTVLKGIFEFSFNVSRLDRREAGLLLIIV